MVGQIPQAAEYSSALTFNKSMPRGTRHQRQKTSRAVQGQKALTVQITPSRKAGWTRTGRSIKQGVRSLRIRRVLDLDELVSC
jgi:hypothetical protein